MMEVLRDALNHVANHLGRQCIKGSSKYGFSGFAISNCVIDSMTDDHTLAVKVQPWREQCLVNDD